MKIIKLELNNEYMSSNCYLVTKGNEAIVIDPSFNDLRLFNYLKLNSLDVKKIILTHGHYDHWTGLEELRNKYPNAPLYASLLDTYWLHNNPFTNYLPEVDVNLDNLEEIMFFEERVNIYKTPGHSKGSVSFHFDNKLISGDVLFYQSIGRSDLKGGDFNELEKSVKFLYALNDDTIVYSGHGRPTTIGHEKLNNPFIKK